MTEVQLNRQKNEILLDVSNDNMKNRQYELLPLVGVNFIDSAYVKDDIRLVPQSEFKAFLKNQLHKSYYKINQVINAYIVTGAIQDDGKGNYIISTVKTRFVGLTKATALYFLETLSEMSLKVYCYLLNKYNIHNAYHHVEPFRFSKKQILEAIGTSRSQVNLVKLNNILFTLEDLGLIKYNHKAHGVPGKHGLYMDLIEVRQYGTTQIKSAKELIATETIVGEALEYVAMSDTVQELANQAKSWLEVGAYDMVSLPEKYQNAYKQCYGE